MDQPVDRVSKGDTQSQVAMYIEQLGDENFRIRSNAMASLDRIGLPAFEQLRAALEHPNIQVSLSAEYLLLSQNVVWWLDTDSHEVRERLQDYSTLSPRDRHTRLQELAFIGTDDALMALCRIAKFESSEWISRAAGLGLLSKLSKLDSDARGPVAKSILLTIDRTDRPATRWLTTFARQCLANQVPSSTDPGITDPGDTLQDSINREDSNHSDTKPGNTDSIAGNQGISPADLEVWKQFAVELTLEVSEKGKIRGEQRLQVLQYYEWLADWSREHQSRLELLELMRPSLALVDASPFAVREYGYWALSVELPELVEEIAKSQASFFENDQELSYLLAEAYRQSGNDVQAETTAAQARKIPKNRSRLLGQLARGGASEIEVAQRAMQARRLRDRGLFDWAEAEYQEALKLESKDRSLVEISLAELYWEGKKFKLAADVLESVVTQKPADAQLPGTLYDHTSIVAHYHWYLALEAAQNNQYDLAISHFRKSLEANASASVQNPDIMISLYRVAQTELDRAFFREQFELMVRHYRSLVSSEEARLAQSNFGQFAGAGAELSEYCNQLAWLLSNCEMHLEEALYLSGRSLEYYPEVPAYLDTMARCCFAAGRLTEAVQYQRKACSLSPHDRLMKAQLSQFEAALTETSATSADGTHGEQ